jgi:hypothetical protein
VAAAAAFGFQVIPTGWIPLLGLIPGTYGRTLIWAGVSVLSAVGLGSLIGEGKLTHRAVRWGLAIAGPVAYSAFFLSDAARGGTLFRILRPEWLLCASALVALLLAASARAIRPAAVAPACLALGLLLDPWVLFSGHLSPETPFAVDLGGEGGRRGSYFNSLDPLAGGPPAVRELKQRLALDHGRFWAPCLPPEKGGEPALLPNLATLWGARDARVVDVFLSRRIVRLDQVVQRGRPETFGTSLTFSSATPGDLAVMGVQWMALPDDETGSRFRVEPVPGALPRAYIAREVIAAKTESEALGSLGRLTGIGSARAGGYAAVIERWDDSPSEFPGDGFESVAWIEDTPARLRFEVKSRGGGPLVLMDAFDGGWHATVDGHRVPIYRANFAFRAVRVPPGAHEVEFVYRPAAVTAGIASSAAGWLILALLGFRSAERFPGARVRPGGEPS